MHFRDYNYVLGQVDNSRIVINGVPVKVETLKRKFKGEIESKEMTASRN